MTIEISGNALNGFSGVVSSLPWFFDSRFYEVYENFDSYSTGAFASNTNWTIGGSGNATISATQNAGGTTNELYLYGGGGNDKTATTLVLKPNRHTYARVYCYAYLLGSNTSSYYCAVRFGNTGSYYNFLSGGSSGVHEINVLSSVLVIANGNNNYDLYVGGKLVASYSDVTEANAQLDFKAYGASGVSTSGQGHLYIDDVRQSKF